MRDEVWFQYASSAVFFVLIVFPKEEGVEGERFGR